MSKIATTDERTIWECESCGQLESMPNAFTMPPDWWHLDWTHRLLSEKNPHVYRVSVDYCSKACVLQGIQYHHYAQADVAGVS